MGMFFKQSDDDNDFALMHADAGFKKYELQVKHLKSLLKSMLESVGSLPCDEQDLDNEIQAALKRSYYDYGE
jgi:hypothetical protein